MASFRSGIKIISDVSKRQGLALLQRSISAENLLCFRGKRSAAVNRSVSPQKQKTGQQPHPTQLAAENNSWFSSFNDRQGRARVLNTDHEKQRRFLVPYKGPQTPNRYIHEYCKREADTYKEPDDSERDSYKERDSPCFESSFKEKKSEETKKEEEESSGRCSVKLAKQSNFCENKSTAKAFSVCPKPILSVPVFRCHDPSVSKSKPKLRPRPEKSQEIKPPTFSVCPKPPSQHKPPMCVTLLPEKKKRRGKKKRRRISAPRRCICEDDPIFIEEEKKSSKRLYKLDPDIPFRVCSKKRASGLMRQSFKWETKNTICEGSGRGICAEAGSSDSSTTKQKPKMVRDKKSCRSLLGDPCEVGVSRPKSTEKRRSSSKSLRKKKRGKKKRASKKSSSRKSSKRKSSRTKSAKKKSSRTKSAKKKSSRTKSAKKKSSRTKSLKKKSSRTKSAKKKSSRTKLAKKKSSRTKVSSKKGKKSSKSDCKKRPTFKTNKKQHGAKFKKFRLPGCRVPKSTSCATKPSKRRPCKKIPVPKRSFSECYKGPCPPKICNPCPCVKMLTSTECDIKFKTRHLQPKEKIFKQKLEFKLPAPAVELFIDPTLGACCEPTKTPAPKPILCLPPQSSKMSKKLAPKTTEKEPSRKGCDCKMFNFVRSLVSYLKGDEKKCPEPSDDIKKVVKQLDKPSTKDLSKTTAKLTACGMDPNASARKPKLVTKKASKKNKKKGKKKGSKKKGGKKKKGDKKKGDKKKKKGSGECKTLRLPGCRGRYRQDCSIEPIERECKKPMPPRPSFSECMKRPFPPIPCTECRIAMKRAKSLSELKEKGLRVTPENLRLHCSMCLKPTTKGCELMSKPLKCGHASHSCLMASCGVKAESSTRAGT